MDPAFLRRIPYKVHVGFPTKDEFKIAFRRVCEDRDLNFDDEDFRQIISFIRSQLKTAGMPLAYYQASFIVDQIIEQCRFDGCSTEFTEERLVATLENLSPRRQATSADLSNLK
jgi:hypothetical protein